MSRQATELTHNYFPIQLLFFQCEIVVVGVVTFPCVVACVGYYSVQTTGQRMPNLCITGDKSLPEPLMTQLTGTYATMLQKVNSPVIAHGSPIFPVRYSVLYADFILRRHMGYFMINVYVPSSLLVVISWVGFWINREATADRIALGKMALKYQMIITFIFESRGKQMEYLKL